MKRTSDFRSDTVTQPTPAMREAMATAEVGDDVYGEDPTVNALEAYTAVLLDKEAAVFVPTATMSNQVAILVHTERGDELYLDQDAHIYQYEVGSPALLAGVSCRPLPHRFGVVDPEAFIDAVPPANIHRPRPRLLSIENTHNRAGGAAIAPEHLTPLIDAARERGISIHLDGSRLFNAAVALNREPAELARNADSVTICLSKGLGAPLGSLLLGSAVFVEKARRYRKALGGGMRQAGVVAAAGLFGLQHHRSGLSDDHRRAATLAQGLAGLPGLHVMMPPVPTNMVMVKMDHPVDPVIQQAQAQGIKLGAMDRRRIRLVTHLDVNDSDVERVLAFFRNCQADGSL